MITVLTTTYNCAPYISQAIKSILIQTYTDFEYLIVDDGSEDNTEIVVNSINDNRIRYIKVKHIGRGAALNLGLREAKNDLIALQDADDISHPLRLEKQLQTRYVETAAIIISDVAYFIDNRIQSVASCYSSTESFKKKLVLHGPFFHATMIFLKEHIEQIGGYNKDLEANEDHELFLRLLKKTRFIFVREVLYFTRLRKNSLSNKPGVTYVIQKKYFENLKMNLSPISRTQEKKLLGWREFYYGNKNLSRKYWRKINFQNWDTKILLAFLLTYLPRNVIQNLIRNRAYLRIKFLFNRLTKFRKLQSEFREILIKIS